MADPAGHTPGAARAVHAATARAGGEIGILHGPADPTCAGRCVAGRGGRTGEASGPSSAAVRDAVSRHTAGSADAAAAAAARGAVARGAGRARRLVRGLA